MKSKKVSFFAACGILLWLILIFWFSAQPVEQSVGLSRRVGTVLARWFEPGFSDWSAKRQEAFVLGIDFAIRKTAHFLEYMILGILLGLVLRGREMSGKAWILAGTALGALLAAGDEFHQLFVEGRTSRWQDVCIDTAGAVLGLCILSLVRRMLSKRKLEKK